MDRNLRLFVVPPVRSSIKTSFFNTTLENELTCDVVRGSKSEERTNLAFHGIATDMQEADSTGSRYKKRTRNGLNVSYVAKQLRRSLQHASSVSRIRTNQFFMNKPASVRLHAGYSRASDRIS